MYFDFYHKNNGAKERRKIALDSFCLGFLDIFVWIAYTIIVVTFWHYRAMRRDTKSAKGYEWYWIVFSYFGKLLLDIPFIFCFLVVILTIWRASALLREIKSGEYGRNEICWFHFCAVFLDLGYVLCFYSVLITVWRFKLMKEELSKVL